MTRGGEVECFSYLSILVGGWVVVDLSRYMYLV